MRASDFNLKFKKNFLPDFLFHFVSVICFLEMHYLILHTLQLYIQLNENKALIDLFIEVSDLFVVCSQLGGNTVFASAVRTEVTQQ